MTDPRLDPTAFRRALRQNATPAERRFWTLTRDRRLAGLKFRRQHSIGAYVVDFYCHAYQLAVELDGAVHEDPQRARYDAERQRTLEGQGVTVLRFSNEEVVEQTGSVVEAILFIVGVESEGPSPRPSPQGEGAS